MSKQIEVDLVNFEDVFEKYNSKLINKNLINYIINEVNFFDKDETVEIIFHNKSKVAKDKYMPLIKKSLKEEYDKCLKEIDYNNIRQLIYLLIGVVLLFISAFIGKYYVFQQIFLIGGWVLIWETIEIEMFADTELKKRRIILKKLLKSQMSEN